MSRCLYQSLGDFSDWVEAAADDKESRATPSNGVELEPKIREILGFSNKAEKAVDPRTERTWEKEGIFGEEISWSVGYGPRTHAWILRPAGSSDRLPGILALHGHDGFKFFGKEKIADGPEEAPSILKKLRGRLYGGRAFANDLAKSGFVVLVPDVFLWGSRRFPIETIEAGTPEVALLAKRKAGDRIERYNIAARLHEHVVAKYCSLLGTTLAGVVSYEDRVALGYLAGRNDVRPGSLGCIGLSGGGCRAALLRATSEKVRAAVIVGMMTTYAELLNRHVSHHTWMFMPPGLAPHCDWPVLAGFRAPASLLIQYNLDDELFTEAGMREAHRQIKRIYQGSDNPDAYGGEFYEGLHKFDLQMQASAFRWLGKTLEDR